MYVPHVLCHIYVRKVDAESPGSAVNPESLFGRSDGPGPVCLAMAGPLFEPTS